MICELIINKIEKESIFFNEKKIDSSSIEDNLDDDNDDDI